MSDLTGRTATDYHDESWSSFVSLFVVVFASVYLTYTPWATSYGAALRKKYIESRTLNSFRRFMGMVVYPIVLLGLFVTMFVATYQLNISEEFQDGPQRTVVVLGRFGGVGATENITIPYPYATAETYKTRENYNAWRTYQFIALVTLYASYVVMLRVPYTRNSTANTRMITWSIVLFLMGSLFAAIMALVAIVRYPDYAAGCTDGYKCNRAVFGIVAWVLYIAFVVISLIVHMLAMFADVPSADAYQALNNGAPIDGEGDGEHEGLLAPSSNKHSRLN